MCQDHLIPVERKNDVFLIMMSNVIHLHEVTKNRNTIPLFMRSFSENVNNNRKSNTNGVNGNKAFKLF